MWAAVSHIGRSRSSRRERVLLSHYPCHSTPTAAARTTSKEDTACAHGRSVSGPNVTFLSQGFGSECHVSQYPVMDARAGPGRDRRRHGAVTAVGGDPATGRRVGPGRREVGPTRQSFTIRKISAVLGRGEGTYTQSLALC